MPGPSREGLALTAKVVVPWVFGFITSSPSTHHPFDPSPVDAPPAAAAADPCPARGLVSHDLAGRVLFCLPPTQPQSYLLQWCASR
jgi:hypothetical protein